MVRKDCHKNSLENPAAECTCHAGIIFGQPCRMEVHRHANPDETLKFLQKRIRDSLEDLHVCPAPGCQHIVMPQYQDGARPMSSSKKRDANYGNMMPMRPGQYQNRLDSAMKNHLAKEHDYRKDRPFTLKLKQLCGTMRS